MQKQINSVLPATLVAAMGTFLLYSFFPLIGVVFIVKLLLETKGKSVKQLKTVSLNKASFKFSVVEEIVTFCK